MHTPLKSYHEEENIAENSEWTVYVIHQENNRCEGIQWERIISFVRQISCYDHLHFNRKGGSPDIFHSSLNFWVFLFFTKIFKRSISSLRWVNKYRQHFLMSHWQSLFGAWQKFLLLLNTWYIFPGTGEKLRAEYKCPTRFVATLTNVLIILNWPRSITSSPQIIQANFGFIISCFRNWDCGAIRYYS
jgi:hypothetical protein